MQTVLAVASKREMLVVALCNLRQKLDAGSARFWGPLAWSYDSPEARKVHEALVAAEKAFRGDSSDGFGDPEIADQFTLSGVREFFVRIYDHLDRLPAPAYVRWLDEIIANLDAEPALTASSPNGPTGAFSLEHQEISRKKPK